jgi:phosphoglycerol transferase MdoB-like AlkP superfamily enzyme
VLPIDFDALSGQTEDETKLALNTYFDALPGTNQNEYTGMLSDYNLIVLCGESFSRAAIHPEVTPTLYKLANEGFLFENYYNTFPNTTTDGEYALLQGLYPDSSRNTLCLYPYRQLQNKRRIQKCPHRQ